MPDGAKIVGELLTKLERRESALMEWGFFDVVHTGDEIVELFSGDPEWGEAFQDLANGSEELFVDDLAEANLLYRVDDSTPRRYRSRFAESVRLMARLRQRFRANDWAYAPELVSQVRLHLASRRFPVRDQSFDQVWQAVTPHCWAHGLQRGVLQALMCNPRSLRLAAFQVRAIVRVLTHYRGMGEPCGTVVTAGTGGGKTKSFYIPALMGIAADVKQDPMPVTRVLALYPRNVLLADQFAEATAQASIINALGLLNRPLRVGALISEVPFTAEFETDRRNQWALRNWAFAQHQTGRLVPHLRHPGSGESLVWTDADRRAGRTVLRRDTAIGEIVVEDGVVCLTREDLIARPPDIFLTSIEMLNKELSGEIGRAVLGFNEDGSSLRMVLLDEIHTYEGLTGAQVPWILRRLAYWVRPGRRAHSLHYVGLSATLQDAPDHLAVLSGVLATRIEEIAPRDGPEEVSVEGQEYNVVLKSHPGSGAGVLSTSIQAVMLGGRLLTPMGTKAVPTATADATQFFGRKVFGFTDNLDVVNRWLPDFKSAEQVQRLARLRSPQDNDASMDAAGQVWKLPVQLGHNLRSSLRVDRISSQDPGIDAGADVVFATSSLEVGYDDPEVGMVLQHKAPRSAASFLQRKGRAGRRQGMRPWAVVVLTDHGRDRWAFRDSEQLFSPVLEPLALPVFNPYLLRIQATWFLVDWIGAKVGQSAPNLYLTRKNYRHDHAEKVVRELLDSPSLRHEFTQAFENWLGGRGGGFKVVNTTSLAHHLLWSPPRAVMRHVVPDLWKFIDSGYETGGRRPAVMPKFIPSTTWEVLDAQEVELHLDADRSELMDARRSLYETVPGRVSRRFVVEHKKPSKWPRFSAQLLSSTPPNTMSIDQLCERWIRVDDMAEIALFQPTAMVFEDVPDRVKNSSNAQWDWQLNVRRTGDGDLLGVHSEGVLAQLFEDSKTWLHRERVPLRVYRFARSCRYEILLARGEVRRGTLRLIEPGTAGEGRASVAVGYTRTVDALEWRIRSDRLATRPVLPADVLQELRTAYLRYLASRSTILLDRASTFAVNNLCASAIGMLVATALHRRLSLEQAWSAIPDKAKAASKVMRAILSVDEDADETENRRLAELDELWQTPEVFGEMERLVTVLWAPFDSCFDDWLRCKFVETVRAAVETAVQAVLPEAPDGALQIESFSDETGTSILVLESDSGGVGIVERLLLTISADPDSFARVVESALFICPGEDIRGTVLATVRAARDPYSELRGVFEEVRNANDYRALDEARRALVAEMRRQDLPTGKRYVTALLSKVLGPGSCLVTERWLYGLTRARQRVAHRLGIAVDGRSFAYWLLNRPRSGSMMAATLRSIIKAEPNDVQVYQAFLRLTLEPCADSCPECLGTDGEAAGLAPSRRLARLWLGSAALHYIEVDDCGTWCAQILEALREHRRVRLRHRADQKTHVATSLARIMTAEIDRGFHSSPLKITGVRRQAGLWETDLEVDSWGGH